GGSPLAIAVDAKTHRAFVANSVDGTVSVLDADTSTVLRTVKVGKDTAALVVDEGTGRVYVSTNAPAPRPPVANPGQVAFPGLHTVNTSSAARTVTFTNVGATNLTFGRSFVAGSYPNDFN